MAISYSPSLPFSAPLRLHKPTYTKVKGFPVASFEGDGILIYGTFKTYGGTEQTVNGLYSVLDTAEIETWYRPDITSDCIIELADTGARYQIMGEPENIARRNQFLKLKVQRVKGGA